MARAVALLVGVLLKGPPEGRGVRPGEHRERRHAVGVARGHEPGHLPAPVVSDDVKARRRWSARRLGQVEHVGDEPIDAVGREIGGRVGAHPGRVASLVGGDGPVAGGAERRDLLAATSGGVWGKPCSKTTSGPASGPATSAVKRPAAVAIEPVTSSAPDRARYFASQLFQKYSRGAVRKSPRRSRRATSSVK